MGPETMQAWGSGYARTDQDQASPTHRSTSAQPGPGQIRIRVRVCGVCRTDLHLAEGDLTPKHHLVIPGHEVVGVVDHLGTECVRFSTGDRVGVPWLAHTCRICRFCVAGRENLCTHPGSPAGTSTAATPST